MSEAIQSYLRNIPIFSRWGAEDLEDLAEGAKVASWEADSPVFKEGNPADNMFLILSGQVRISKKNQGGQETELSNLEVGAFFGELALIDGSPRSTSAYATSPCEFIVITRDYFSQMLADSPRLIPEVFASMAGKIRTFNEQFLIELCEKQKLREEIAQERYRTISQIASSASDASSTNEAMQIVLDKLCDYIHWPVGHVYVTNSGPQGSLFSSSIWHLDSPHTMQKFRGLSEITRYSEGIGLPGKVITRKRPVWVEDISKDSSCPRALAAEEMGFKSAFAFPVLVDRKVSAVLEFYSEKTVEADRLLMQSTEQIGIQLGRQIERNKFQKQLMHNAFHDALTDLPNRSLFMDHLGLSLVRSKREKNYMYSVLFIDLDRFKLVNDSLGHQAGDALLIEVGQRLRNSVRTTDTVARLGGDEFGILLDNISQLSDVPRTIERIQSELQKPILIEEREVYTSTSIGVALSTTGYSEADSIVRDADTAMYQSKSQGPGRYAVFDPLMHEHAVKRLSLENDLWHAVDRGELRLHYQPIVRTDTLAVEGFEALIRWEHPTRGMIAPGEFLPIAEETELIIPITDWVLEEACKQINIWRTQQLTNRQFSISTNISPKYLAQLDLYDRISGLIHRHKFDPGFLKVEITEGHILNNPLAVANTVTRLHELGIHVHIDDFGTGYSSLSYLSTLHVHGLKIDKSFIDELSRSDRGAAMVRTIISMGINMGLDIIAEGVECEEQLDALRKSQCLYVQGFLLARPMIPEKAGRILSDGYIMRAEQAENAIVGHASVDSDETVSKMTSRVG